VVMRLYMGKKCASAGADDASGICAKIALLWIQNSDQKTTL